MTQTPLRLLYIEDDENDAFLMRRVLDRYRRPVTIQHVNDGIEAVSLLEKAPDHEMPHLIVSDLKMPRMDGLQFTAWLRQSRYSCLPVVIFTSSTQSSDAARAYKLGANSVASKPCNVRELEAVVSTMIQYWDDVCAVKEHSQLVDHQCN